MTLSRAQRQRFRDHAYEVFAGVGRALANGRRLVIFDMLCQAERNVEEIADETGVPFASVSQHLQVLRNAGLVTSRRDGARVYYRVAGPQALALWQALRDFSEAEVPAVDRVVDMYLSDRRELEAISAEELRRRLDDGSVVLIDVRPAREFDAAHIPAARSLPIDELESRIGELPEGIEIIAYCRGRYCVWADDAVRTLRQRGFQARRLELAAYDWR